MKTRHWIALLLASIVSAPAAAGVVEEVVEIPVAVKDIYAHAHRHTITVTVFRDDQRAKSPFLVLSHGRAGTAAGRHTLGRARYPDNSRYFVSRGFAVFVPTRVGYGITGGPDVENSGTCSRRDFPPAFEAGAVQTIAVIEHAKRQSFVDPNRGVLVGQSVGGAITIALAARNIPGVAGAINFAGGAGGDPDANPENPCSEGSLRGVLAAFGEKSKTPMLWLYSENDRYWGKQYPRAWFDAYRARGGAAEFVQLPSYKTDGHGSFVGNPGAWKPAVETFLATIGFAK